MTSSEETCLIQRAKEESESVGDWKIQFELDLASALALCGNLQLALRHPHNNGPSAKVARELIDNIHDGLLGRNLTAHAKMIELGDDPDYDYDPKRSKRHNLSLVKREGLQTPSRDSTHGGRPDTGTGPTT